MTTDAEYLAWAEEQDAINQEHERKARIANLAAQAKHRVETAALHAVLRQKHALHESAGPREISDAWIDHQNRWRSFVSCRFGGHATAAQILAPESAPPELRAEFQARQDKMREEFERTYDAEVATRPATGRADDGFHGGHSTGLAA